MNVIILLLLMSYLIDFFIKKILKKYTKIDNSFKYNGQTVAEKIIEYYQLNVSVLQGNNSSYIPKLKLITLTPDDFKNPSIASVAVAAHECGHARQHYENNLLYRIVMISSVISTLFSLFFYVVVIVYFLNIISYPVALVISFISCFIDILKLIFVIPIEIDASKRGLNDLINIGIIQEGEIEDTKKVLKLAASTYIYGLLFLIIQCYIIYFIYL